MTPTYGIKLAIVGSRGFSDYPLLCQTMFDHFYDHDHSEEGSEWRIDEVISGGAVGADSLGARWADEYGIPKHIIRPDYVNHDRYEAPLIRNGLIAERCTMMLAFWTGEMKSGTRNAIGHATRLRKPTLIIYV